MQPLAVAGKSFAFSQSDVSALASAWWDFSDETTLFSDAARTVPVTTNNEYVKGIADKSGHGNHATSGAGSPFQRNVKGALSAVKIFDMFQTGSIATFPSKRGAVIAVIIPTHAADYKFYVSTFAGAGVTWAAYSAVSGAYKPLFYDGAGNIETAAYDVTNNVTIKTLHRIANTTMNYRKDAALSAALTITDNQPNPNILYIGGYSTGVAFPDGYFCDLLTFNDISANDLQKVERYLSQKWNIANPIINPLAVAFGDSITAGVGASENKKTWVEIVSASKSWRMINAGVSGSVLQNTTQNTVATIGAAVDGNGRDAYSTRVLTHAPSHVLVLYGLNDLRLNDAAFTSANYQNDLSEIIDGIIAGGVLAGNIVIGSPPLMTNYSAAAPYNAGSSSKQLDYAAACSAVATAKGTKYVDIYQWMLSHGGISLLSDDDIHPNDAGHAEIAAGFLSVI